MKKLDDNGIWTILLGMVLFIIIILFFVAIIWLTLGMLGFIGLCLLFASAFILFMSKGALVMSPASPFTWCLLLGILFLCLSTVVRLDIMYEEIEVIRQALLNMIP